MSPKPNIFQAPPENEGEVLIHAIEGASIPPFPDVPENGSGSGGFFKLPAQRSPVVRGPGEPPTCEVGVEGSTHLLGPGAQKEQVVDVLILAA
jgi:hypothetical protein